MKTMKRALAVLLAAVLLCVGVPLAVADDVTVVDSGTCGDNLTWSLNSEGMLMINGAGAIDNNAFQFRTDIKSVEIGEDVTSIGDSAFFECFSLERVVIGDGVKNIGDSAFRFCTNLTDVTIGNSVESIGAFSFCGCYELKNVTIGSMVTSIGMYAFQYCISLTSVVIPNGVTTIGGCAFFDCGLTSLIIPESVVDIGLGAFTYCGHLTNIYVDDNNPVFTSDSNGCLLNKSQTELLQYPIGNEKCSVSISDSVRSISAGAFSCCTNLTSITIPQSVTKINTGAFEGCDNLTAVYYCGSETDWAAIAISSNNTPLQTATLHYHNPGTPVRENEQPATCKTAASYESVTYCTICGEELSRVTVYEGAPNPDAHNPGEPVRENEQPATCKTAASYEAVTYCTLCGEELSRETVYEGEPDPEAHDMQIQSYVSPTCEEEGYAPFVCSFCGYTEKTDPEPALGHDYQPTYEWSADNSTVTASLVCTRCGDVSLKEVADVTAEVTVKPTCSTEGELTLTAAFNNKAFYAQTKTKVLPTDPDAHVFKVTVTAPTCVDEGYTTHACTLCRYGYSDEIVPALGHTPVEDAAVPATCEAAGLTAGSHCGVCGETLTAQEETPALDHTDTDNDGKCDTCGDQMQGGDHCKVCGKVHNGGFFDKLTGFFHKIIGIFKR